VEYSDVGLEQYYDTVYRYPPTNAPFWRKIGKSIFFQTPIIPKPEVEIPYSKRYVVGPF